MPRFDESLTVVEQLALAVRAHPPTHIARHFAAHVGQFYCRHDFDALARRASALYETRSGTDAWRFRVRLDQRLADRHRAPVRWELDATEPSDDRAA